MSDPFRSELEAAHARLEKLEADHKTQIEKLEHENDRLRKRLVDAAPPSQNKTGKTFMALAMMLLGISLAIGIVFARISRPPSMPLTRPLLEIPVEIQPNAVEIGDDTADPSDFDREAVANALKGVRLASCVTSRGSGHVKLVIAPSGVVTEAHVDRGAFTSTPEGQCIEARFREVRVPTFTGSPRTVGKAFTI
jgi:hypothetical protein